LSTPYEPNIGLEIHCQLKTETKIFCGCSTRFGADPNSQVCPVCLGLPGALPVLNRRVVQLATRIALATGCTVHPRSRFARKSYFYPDLPKGYQISQYDEPLATGGRVEFDVDGQEHAVRLIRIHLEEDAGKSMHLVDRPISLVDFNRSGVPLVEMVSEPEIRSPAEAAEVLRSIRALVRALGVSDGNMEQGSLRCDANVSLRPRGSATLGTKAEVKNMNSFRHVERALAYEIERQTDVLRSGGRVVQETRLWNADRDATEPMRSKEAAHDYRYFPDPDLPPLEIAADWIDQVRREMPESPRRRRARFQSEYGLVPYDAGVLCSERELADYFEAIVRSGAEPRTTAHFVINHVLSRVPDAREVLGAPVSAERLAELLSLQTRGTISGKIAKDVFARMWETGQRADDIVRSEGLLQVSDTDMLEQVCRRVVEENAAEAERYRRGERRLLGYLVGQAMRVTSGKANPKRIDEILRKLLDG